MNSDTPRTDAQMESPNEQTCPIEFARSLERELNKATADAEAWKKSYYAANQERIKLKGELEGLKAIT